MGYLRKFCIITGLAALMLNICGTGRNAEAGDRQTPADDSPRIVCLSFDALEMVNALDCARMVVGLPSGSDRSAFPNAVEAGSFFSPDMDVVQRLKPDLVITSSDIQAAAAGELVRRHFTVLALNMYTIDDIYNTLHLLGRVLGRPNQGRLVAASMRKKIDAIRAQTSAETNRPRVHFEEYNDPCIAGGEWNSEMIVLAGGIDVNADDMAGFQEVNRSLFNLAGRT